MTTKYQCDNPACTRIATAEPLKLDREKLTTARGTPTPEEWINFEVSAEGHYGKSFRVVGSACTLEHLPQALAHITHKAVM